jgi:hypothetical protein
MPYPALFGILELRALGGAMARVPVEATAFAHRHEPFIVTVSGSTLDPGDLERQRAWTEDVWSALRAHTRGVYMNFLDDEGADPVRGAYTPATYARLAAIKRDYDPANLFHLNQNICPAARTGDT